CACRWGRSPHERTGSAAAGVVHLAPGARPPQSVIVWQQVADRLRSLPGIQTAAVAGFAPLSGSMEGGFVSVGGGPPGGSLVRFLSVSPTWFDAMKVPILSGREFLDSDTSPGVAIVNQTFARIYFNGAD